MESCSDGVPRLEESVDIPVDQAYEGIDWSAEGWRRLLELPGFVIALLNKDLRYLAVSQSYANLFGKVAAEIVGLTVPELLPPLALELAMPHLEAVLRGETPRYDTAVPYRTGLQHLSVVYQPIRHQCGAVVGFLMTGRDHSEALIDSEAAYRREQLLARIEAQNATIRAMNQRLLQSQEALAERAASTVELQKQLRLEAERRNEEKGQFIAEAVHDLRQPVQAMVNLLWPLRNMIGKDSNPGAQDLLNMIEAAVDTLSRQLSGILDLSRLELGQIKPLVEAIPVSEVLDDLAPQLTLAAQARQTTLHLDTSTLRGLLIRSDRNLLERVIVNLVTNGCKYSDPQKAAGSWVRITHEAVANGTMLRLCVIDNGVGISEDDLQSGRIFRPFYQGHSARQANDVGVGLGLSIVRSIVQALPTHSLHIESQLGEGTTVVLQLPLEVIGKSSPPPTPTRTLPNLKALEGLRLLFVDDSVLVREATQAMLGVLGAQVVCASSLEDLRQRLVNWTGSAPQLLITDHHLGGGAYSGEAMALARRYFDGLPCIIISGDPKIDHQVLEVEQSTHILLKPVRIEDILAAVEALVAKAPTEMP